MSKVMNEIPRNTKINQYMRFVNCPDRAMTVVADAPGEGGINH